MSNCADCPPVLPCPPEDPCTCIGIGVPYVAPKPCPAPGNCLVLCDIVITPMNGVGPCGQSGSINVADTGLFGHNFDACNTDPVRWKVISVEGPIVEASITSAGVLTWITGGPETAGKVGTVTLFACCGMLSAYMQVLIGVRDLCNCPECNECDVCDPCTGNCIEPEVNMAVGGLTTASNLSVNGG